MINFAIISPEFDSSGLVSLKENYVIYYAFNLNSENWINIKARTNEWMNELNFESRFESRFELSLS